MPISPDPARILIVKLGPASDLCRCVPLAASLRLAYPHARIDWLTRQPLAALIEAHPAIDTVISIAEASRDGEPARPPSRRRQAAAATVLRGRTAAEVRKHLRDHRDPGYDIVIDAHGWEGSGRIVRATGAPIRIGRADAGIVERLGYTVRVPRRKNVEKPIHRIEQFLDLLKPIHVEPQRDVQLAVRNEDAAWWQQRRENLGIYPHAGPYAVLAPCTRWLSKRWPIERWAELIGPLLYRGFTRIIMVGSADDREQVRPLRALNNQTDPSADHPFTDLTGETDIGQLMAVLAGAGLVIASDTAPLHIAAGLNRPCVGLFGPTDPAAGGPYSQPEAALRAFVARPGEIISHTDPKLGDALMRIISTTAVIQKIDRVLSRFEANTPVMVGDSERGGGSA